METFVENGVRFFDNLECFEHNCSFGISELFGNNCFTEIQEPDLGGPKGPNLTRRWTTLQ